MWKGEIEAGLEGKREVKGNWVSAHGVRDERRSFVNWLSRVAVIQGKGCPPTGVPTLLDGGQDMYEEGGEVW